MIGRERFHKQAKYYNKVGRKSVRFCPICLTDGSSERRWGTNATLRGSCRIKRTGAIARLFLERNVMTTRRRFLRASSLLAALPLTNSSGLLAADPASGEILRPATAPSATGKDPWRGLHVGMASYSFRKLPLDVTIAAIKRVDLHYVSIKDAHLPLKSTTEERKSVAAQFRDAGITPISCGVISTKNDEGSIRQAFEYARHWRPHHRRQP